MQGHSWAYAKLLGQGAVWTLVCCLEFSVFWQDQEGGVCDENPWGVVREREGGALCINLGIQELGHVYPPLSVLGHGAVLRGAQINPFQELPLDFRDL